MNFLSHDNKGSNQYTNEIFYFGDCRAMKQIQAHKISFKHSIYAHQIMQVKLQKLQVTNMCLKADAGILIHDVSMFTVWWARGDGQQSAGIMF